MDINNSIRPKVLHAYGVLWLLIFGLAIWLNGGLGPIHNPVSLLLVGIICGLGAFGLFGSLISTDIRHRIIRNNVIFDDAKADVLLTGSILLIISGSCFVYLVL